MATNKRQATNVEPSPNQPPEELMKNRSGLGHRCVYSAVEGSLAKECLLTDLDEKQPPFPAINGAEVLNETANHRVSPPPQEPSASASDYNTMTPAHLDSDPELEHTWTTEPTTHTPWSPQTKNLELKKAINQAICDDNNGDTFYAQDVPMRDVSGVSTSDYVSSVSASQSTAPTGPASAIIGNALPLRTSRLRTATNIPRAIKSGQPSMVPSSSTIGMDEGPNSTGRVAETLMKTIADFKLHLDKSLTDMREQNRSDFNRVFVSMQNDSGKRSLNDGRLHSQLLLQSESMVAMEVKLLRLEAKVERKDATMRLRRPGSGLLLAGGGGGSGAVSGLAIGTLPTIATTTSPNTIDEDDNFETMEIHVSNRTSRGSVREPSPRDEAPPGHNVVVSSGASLASAVTATSFLDCVEEHVDSADDGASGRSDDGDVEDEGGVLEEDAFDGSHSTPTQGSGRHFTNIGSILLNPITNLNLSEQGTSTRATRGDYDGNSSLATSATSATISSTVITATTRGGDSTNPRSLSQLTTDGALNEENVHEDNNSDDSGVGDVADSITDLRRGRDRHLESMLGLSPPLDVRARSRSHSPLTVQSAATASLGPMSLASASIGGSVLTTAAVAPARSFRARRDAASKMGNDNRPLANRVVTFTSNEVLDMAPLPQEISEAGDSITMPDELDNLSDVADTFENRARLWREDYEARLDAVQKRFLTE